MLKVHGEVEVDSRLPTSSIPRIGMRLKIGNGGTIEDIAIDQRCNYSGELIQSGVGN